MNRRIFSYCLIFFLLSACAGVDRKRAIGKFEYADKDEAQTIVIPDGLTKPPSFNDYYIEEKKKFSGPVGKSVDIRAPSLVLPIAESSRTIPETNEAIIWFDKVLEDRVLIDFLHEGIKEQLLESNVALVDKKDEPYHYESDWFHTEIEGGYIFTHIEVAESMRFKYELDAKPHGRSVSLKVSLIDYLRTDSEGGSNKMDVIDQHRAEIMMLNNIVSQIDFKYRKAHRDLRLQRALQKMVSIGESPIGEPAYIVEHNLDFIWGNLPFFFEKHGFVITDLNETKKIYFVDFAHPDVGIWDRIWGDTPPKIEIDEAKYQFMLTEMGNKTALTIYDVHGAPLPAETLEKAFPVMEPGLSFRDKL